MSTQGWQLDFLMKKNFFLVHDGINVVAECGLRQAKGEPYIKADPKPNVVNDRYRAHQTIELLQVQALLSFICPCLSSPAVPCHPSVLVLVYVDDPGQPVRASWIEKEVLARHLHHHFGSIPLCSEHLGPAVA